MWFKRVSGTRIPDDPEIISRYRETGENRYVGMLFEKYAHLVFGVCMKYLKHEADSQDAMMQVFANLHDDLKKYDIRSFAPWLHSVAKNHCLMILRKRQLLRNEEAGYRQEEATLLTLPPQFRFMNEDIGERHLRHLDEALTALGPEQRRCITLFYLEEKSYREVSRVTGYTMQQVKSYIQNGKRNLRNYLLTHGSHAKG